MNPSMTIGGTPLYPMAGTVNPDLPIYRPEYGGGGLLNDGRDFQNLRRTFAGGLLNGAQYDPNTNQFNAIAPSGIYTTNPDQAAPVTDEGVSSDYRLTFRDVIDMRFDPRERQMFMDVFGGTESDGRTLSIVGLDLDQGYDPSDEKWLDALSRYQNYGDSTATGGRR